jgi:transcription elongation factor GreB
MNKAFTRESAEDDDAPELTPHEPELPPGTRNYVTPAGAQTLRDELARLTEGERPALLAAANSTESPAGADARRSLREVERRIAFLTRRVASLEVVDPAGQAPDRVRFGATVTVRDARGAERAYTIVGIDEADARRGRVSWLSPVARALLNAAVGDEVTLRSPAGAEELEVARIAYPPDADAP